MILSLVLFICIFITGELLFSRGIRPDFTRKIVHILSGAAILALSFRYSTATLIRLGCIFSVVMLIDYKYRILKGINNVSSRSIGGPLFPIGGTLALLLSISKPIAFHVSILTITLADPIVWYIFTQTRYKTENKTIAGSAIFGCITYLVWISTGYISGILSPAIFALSIVSSIVVAISDYFSVNGTDNLFILIISAFMARLIF